MATSEDDNMEAPSTDEAKDTPSQLNHLDSGMCSQLLNFAQRIKSKLG